MATWLHPMIPIVQSLARAGTHPIGQARTTLPPLLRVWAAHVAGEPVTLARHETHVLPGALPPPSQMRARLGARAPSVRR
jgi:hypothetical protein